jgi:trk system potassium uptake protein TrkH
VHQQQGGPGLKELVPAGNFIPLTDFQNWICSFTMILGRLEVMALLAVLRPPVKLKGLPRH